VSIHLKDAHQSCSPAKPTELRIGPCWIIVGRLPFLPKHRLRMKFRLYLGQFPFPKIWKKQKYVMLRKKNYSKRETIYKVRSQWYIAFLFWWYLYPSWTQPPSHCRSEGPPWTATRPVAPWPSRRSPAVAGCRTWSPGDVMATVCFGKSHGDFAAEKKHTPLFYIFLAYFT